MDTTQRSVGDLCSRDVITVPRATSVSEAARLLREGHVGCLVVVEDTSAGKIVVGMLTDRDIVTAVVAKETDPTMLRVGDVMSEGIFTIGEEASTHSAVALMRHRRVRRLPVVSPGGVVVGLLSADDLIRFLGSELQSLAGAIGAQRRVEQLARP